MTTKEQERKAHAQIKKIVEGLGENSYIGTAFEGCFEIAEMNIENDWACSMKQRTESAESKRRLTTFARTAQKTGLPYQHAAARWRLPSACWMERWPGR